MSPRTTQSLRTLRERINELLAEQAGLNTDLDASRAEVARLRSDLEELRAAHDLLAAKATQREGR